MNDRLDVVDGAVVVRDGRIVSVGAEPDGRYDTVINAGGAYLLPGFIQTHIHLCQTLFRGYADDMPLLEWLRRRIWPMEAAHSPATLRARARLAAAELLLAGTTTVLTMETVHDTDVVFETLAETGLRATVGKCMMDSDDEVPARLQEQTQRSIDESLALARALGRRGGRPAARGVRAAIRGVVLARAARSGGRSVRRAPCARPHARVGVARRSRSRSAPVGGPEQPRVPRRHGPRDAAAVRRALRLGHRTRAGAAGRARRQGHALPRLEPEARIGRSRRSSRCAQRGICVSLGADGAACNNRLDMFDEMRLAATLQAVRHAPGALTARDALWMATREGARALGLEDEIGSIELGKRADLILVERDRPHLAPDTDPWSTLVYAAARQPTSG